MMLQASRQQPLNGSRCPLAGKMAEIIQIFIVVHPIKSRSADVC